MRHVISFEEFYESIWLKIPDVWRNSDADYGRPLQLLTLTLAQHFYYSFYLKLSSMDELFDPDKCPDKYLPFLAATIDWKLLGTDPQSWRNQIRHAPLLYKIRGTRKGITIAEKLVGYSVFMTELYRDYTGKIVPKERMFNNFPVSVKVKPWFRKTTPDISVDIFNDSFSDLLPAFNVGAGDISNLGSLVTPRALKKVASKTISLSTLSTYNPVTGEGSIARLAKLPRINVVLKKDLELDHIDENGRYTDANLNEAVDLFIRFKPFHVYISDLLVMYSLSDYVLGSQNDKTAGTGDLSGDTILYRESTDIYVTVQEDDKISYYDQTQLPSIVNDPSLESVDTSLFKGNLELNYTLLDLSAATKITNVASVTRLGFSLAGYSINYQTDHGKSIWSADDFELFNTPDLPNSSTTSQYWDIKTHTIHRDSLIPVPTNDFLSVPFPTEAPSNLKQLFSSVTNLTENTSNWYSSIESVTLDPTAFGKDTIQISGTPYSITSNPSASISLKGISSFRNALLAQSISTLPYKLFNTATNTNNTLDLLAGTIQVSTLELVRLLVKEQIIVVMYWSGAVTLLKHKYHYVYDAVNNTLVFNTVVLASGPDAIFHVVYPSVILNNLGFSLESSLRNINAATQRTQSVFNRITYIDNSHIQTEIDTAHYIPELEFDDVTGTLIENLAKTKLFKESLPRVFTRNSLHNEDTGTVYKAVSYSTRSVRDTSLWKVYTDPAATLYRGAERLSKTIWANYHNIPFSGTATVAYDSLDLSGDAQITNRQSFRWLATLENTNEAHPQYFVSSRLDLESRHSLWTRGSAQKMARPFIGSSRASVQGFRKDNALFNRTENLPDYHVSLLTNYNTDNYKYSSGVVDYTDMYRNPTIPFNPMPLPKTENAVFLKTKIINGKIQYPSYVKNNYAEVGYIPQYEGPFDSFARETYYATDQALKPSLYAANIRMDMNPYTGDLLDEFADPVEFNIDGLEKNTVTFTAASTNDIEFVLGKINVFVSWREINTGNSVGTGLFPLVDYTKVRPSVKVLKNGLELPYGTWTMASNPNRILIPSGSVSIGDTFSVDFYTLDSQVYPTYPTYPVGTIPAPITDNIVVPPGFDFTAKEVLFKHVFAVRPGISWYRGDTGDFIGVSSDTGLMTVAPRPNSYRELAYPNVIVRKNGIDVTYLKYWEFVTVPNTGVSFQILFTQNFVQSMQPTDIITVTYVGLT